MKQITLVNPFDAHMHWRQHPGLLREVAPYSMKQFAGGLLMPNTNPKIMSIEQLKAYRGDVLGWIQHCESDFLPIFTYYLSTELSKADLMEAWAWKLIHGVKYYPKGGTTASDKGLIGFKEVSHLLEIMQREGIPLLIHGETPELDGKVVDDFEREEVFLETEMRQLVAQFPKLRIVLEHITTKAAAEFVFEHEELRATVTPQHCLLDRRGLFNGYTIDGREAKLDLNKNGMHPSLMCRPILKHERELTGIQDMLKLQAKRGLKKIGLGTDTAPHTTDKKYCECGACGVFSAPIALELYAMAFEQMGILDYLPVFACEIMPEFYGIKYKLRTKSSKIITLKPEPLTVLSDYSGIVTPFAGMQLPWTAVVEK